MIHQLWSPKRLIGLGVLASSLLGGTLFASESHAAYSICRTDPIVTLSDGTQVTLYEDISDSATDVTGISYQLHIPVGLKVTSISYLGAVSRKLQSISVTADDNAGDFDAYTMVNTATPNISVTAYMSANALVSCQTAGHSGQELHSHLHLA